MEGGKTGLKRENRMCEGAEFQGNEIFKKMSIGQCVWSMMKERKKL